MNSQTYSEFAHSEDYDQMKHVKHNSARDEPHLAIQVLSILAFGVIGIVAVSLAFAAFWVAGLLTTMIIAAAWVNSRVFGKPKHRHVKQTRQVVSDVAPFARKTHSSGNTNFDAYRTQMMESLEQESREFEGFLARLRDAEGKMEFDQYMDDRADAAKAARTEIALLESIDQKA